MMGADSPLPLILLMVWVYALLRVCELYVTHRLPWLVSDKSHNASIDGLRGYLALGVVVHHAVITFYAQHGSAWQDPPSRIYTLSGQVGVALFFMITGHLFWDKAVRSKGRIACVALFWGRCKRLTPAYVLSLVLVLLAASMPWGVHHLSEVGVKDIAKVVQFKGLRPLSDINGVYWSLVWEWRFYLLLPLCALGIRLWHGWGAIVPALSWMAYVLWKPENAVVLNFVVGGAAVYLRPIMKRLTPRVLDGMVVVPLVVTFTLFDTAYGWAQSVVLGVGFVAVVSGANMWGVLHTHASRMLGTISYSIYLLHCIVLYVAVHSMHALGISVAQMDLMTYWALMPWCVLVVLVVSLVSYRLCEYPFMAKQPLS
jgi:peptidoglycan/LPS O-acetylase OafA/YrhL